MPRAPGRLLVQLAGALSVGVPHLAQAVVRLPRGGGGEAEVKTVENPEGKQKGFSRVRRGGCWCSSPARCRSADRIGFRPSFGFGFLGFRVVVAPVQNGKGVK